MDSASAASSRPLEEAIFDAIAGRKMNSRALEVGSCVRSCMLLPWTRCAGISIHT